MPLDFVGAGKTRTPEQAQQAGARRDRDIATAARLAAQGVNAFSSPGEIVMVDLATMGAIVENRGPLLRRLPVFETVSGLRQRDAGALVAAWCQAEGPARRDRQIVHVRLRPLAGAFPVAQTRARHAADCKQLGDRMERIARRGDAIPLWRGTHHRPMQNGAMIDLHHHVAIDVQRGASLARLTKYLRKRYDVWVGDPTLDPTEHGPAVEDGGQMRTPPEALARYTAAGMARHVAEFGDEALAEYALQIPKLHMNQCYGPLKAYSSALRKDGLRAGIDGDTVRLMPIQTRPKRRADAPLFQVGPRVLAVRTAWIETELRPCAVVSGWTNWSALETRYDLRLAVEAACAALRLPTPKTVTPESPMPAIPVPVPEPPEIAPVHRDETIPRDDSGPPMRPEPTQEPEQNQEQVMLSRREVPPPVPAFLLPGWKAPKEQTRLPGRPVARPSAPGFRRAA